MYDLLIKGGTVIDAALGLNDVRDVAVADGKIAAVEDRIDGDAREVVDAAGLIVTPGSSTCTCTPTGASAATASNRTP